VQYVLIVFTLKIYISLIKYF